MKHQKLLAKQLMLGALLSFFFSKGYSEPPKEVIKSCHQEKATDSAIKFTELMVGYGYENEKITSCPSAPALTDKINKRDNA